MSDATLKRITLGNLGTAYLQTGQVPKAIACYEQALALARENKDSQGECVVLNWLGNCYGNLGLIQQAIDYYEQSLSIAREITSRKDEGHALGNLGNRYAELGQTRRAIEVYEQALAICREIGDRRGEGADLSNIAERYGELGDFQRALEYYELALANAREIGNRYGEAKRLRGMAEILIDQTRYTQALSHLQESVEIGAELNSPEVNNEAHYSLALAHLYSGNLPVARAAAQQARQYDYPLENHNVVALLGVVALRQNDSPAAREAFSAALAHAEGLLAHTPDYFEALDAKALALTGMGEIENARAAYQAARAVNSDPGIVQRATRLLNQLEGVTKFWEE
ncbi:MAG: tetratricopeptide repeat protein [Roseiflexaceae bacterium]